MKGVYFAQDFEPNRYQLLELDEDILNQIKLNSTSLSEHKFVFLFFYSLFY